MDPFRSFYVQDWKLWQKFAGKMLINISEKRQQQKHKNKNIALLFEANRPSRMADGRLHGLAQNMGQRSKRAESFTDGNTYSC